jgi:hypothetical protein
VTAEMAGKESGHYELPQALVTIFAADSSKTTRSAGASIDI